MLPCLTLWHRKFEPAFAINNMTQSVISLSWKVAEYLFVGFFVLILPIWFPLLVIYVIIDPPYYLALWSSKMKKKRDKS